MLGWCSAHYIQGKTTFLYIKSLGVGIDRTALVFGDRYDRYEMKNEMNLDERKILFACLNVIVHVIVSSVREIVHEMKEGGRRARKVESEE